MADGPARILYLAPSGQVGGAERCLLSLIGGLDPARFTARVLIGSEGPLEALLAGQGTPAQVVALPGGLRRLSRFHPNRGLGARLAPVAEAPGYLLRLRRAGGEFRPDLIHSNGWKMHVLGALARPGGAPLVWHLHDFPAAQAGGNGAEPAANRILHGLSGLPRLAVANSEAVAAAYRQRLPRLAPKLRVVHNGVNVEAFRHGDRAAMRARLGFGPDEFVVGMVAIFAPWKGHRVFLEAARRVRAQAPEARFLIVGDDIYDTSGHGQGRAQLEALAANLGLQEAARFTGFIAEDIAGAYAALDVLVHASTAPEPFGRTIIEAMAAGVPVVAARGGGVAEIVSDGENGLLTPPGDAVALADSLLRLQADAGLRRHLAEAGLKRVRDRFSEAAVSAAMAKVYAEAMA